MSGMAMANMWKRVELCDRPCRWAMWPSCSEPTPTAIEQKPFGTSKVEIDGPLLMCGQCTDKLQSITYNL